VTKGDANPKNPVHRLLSAPLLSQGKVHWRALRMSCRPGLDRLSGSWCTRRSFGWAEPSTVETWWEVARGFAGAYLKSTAQ
jgi:hypothetical protein